MRHMDNFGASRKNQHGLCEGNPSSALTVLRETKQPLDKSPHGLENSKTKQLDKQTNKTPPNS